MKTSYYNKYKGKNAISIALSKPKWYICREYKKLAPSWNLLKKYKIDGNKEYYIKEYYNEILNKLDAKKVYKELGKDSVLLCWEKTGEFCHRKLVAEWLEQNIGIKIDEY